MNPSPRGHCGLVRACLVSLLALPAVASDWPQFLGPTRDAVYAGPALAEDWPQNGPPVVWTTDLGEGYSNPVVGEGRLVVCHRLGEDLIVDCLDPLSGHKLWSFKHTMKFQDGAGFDSGPRPTPTINAGHVFVHNTDGYFVCLGLEDGKKVWSHHTRSEFKSSATWFGSVASPLITEKTVILPVGGSNASIVAFAPATGEILWQAFDDKATASSPVLATFDGKPQVLVVTRTALRGLNPDTGQGYWQYPTLKQGSGTVFAASPVVVDDRVFLSGWYGLGAILLRVKGGQPEKIWSGNNNLSTHYANGIVYQDHIYGFHGHGWERGGPNLRCVELGTGKIVWEQPQVGSGTLIRADNNLLILADTGELQLAKANPKEFKIKGRAHIVGRVTRNYPAIADGYVYVRGPRKLVCLDLRAKK